MSKAALTENLGTIARSGTSDFLEKLEKGGNAGEGGNLIGQASRMHAMNGPHPNHRLPFAVWIGILLFFLGG